MAQDGLPIIQALGALALVVGLLLLCAFILKKYTHGAGWHPRRTGASRLAVVDRCYVSPQHVCVILRRDMVEYVVLVSATSATVIDTITRGEPHA